MPKLEKSKKIDKKHKKHKKDKKHKKHRKDESKKHKKHKKEKRRDRSDSSDSNLDGEKVVKEVGHDDDLAKPLVSASITGADAFEEVKEPLELQR